MKSPKGLVLLAIILFGGLFIGFKTIGENMSQKQRLLLMITQLLQEQHYSPQTINDDFSKKVFKKYFEELDGDKHLFLQSDIDALKKYETLLDNEMLGKDDIDFLPELNKMYDKRTDELITIYRDILSQPFNFDVEEEIVIKSEQLSAPKTESERKDRIRKKLKFLTLERYADLIEQRDKSVVDSIKQRTNAQLEIEARGRVLKTMDKMYTRIKATFKEDERFNAYVNVITTTMDPHTDYFPPVEKRAFDEAMSGRFFGIGAQLTEQDGIIKIASILTGGPAWKHGELMAGDIILKVAQGEAEPTDVGGFDVPDAVKIIRGAKGTEVRLTVKKQDGTVKVISLIRDEIVQDESFVRSAIVKEEGKKIGYIYLPDFYADFENPNGAHCSNDVAKELEKLKKENVDGVVLDLRFNGGGSLYEVVQMVGLFIPEGPVVQVRDKGGKTSVLKDKNPEVLYTGPLAVMVNEVSASASEIFAAAIQDYKRGIIVGSTSSYGKGTVQRNVPVGKFTDFFNQRSEFGAVKLTLQKFYRINGGSTQLKGVNPDVVFPDVYEYLKIREKDNVSSLPWDEIEKAPFTVTDFNTKNTIDKTRQTVNSNPIFNIIKTNTAWLEKNIDAPKSLKYETYVSQQKNIKTTVAQNNSILKMSKELSIDVLKDDYAKFYENQDKSKQDRYQAWLRNIKSDVYLSETAKMVVNMAKETGVASTNNGPK